MGVGGGWKKNGKNGQRLFVVFLLNVKKELSSVTETGFGFHKLVRSEPTTGFSSVCVINF